MGKQKQNPVNDAFTLACERLGGLSSVETFRRIYQTRMWGGRDSVSGTGSTLEATKVLRAALPGVFQRLRIRRLLDMPCGDFGWFSQASVSLDDYIGADLVPELIVQNTVRFRHSHPRARFQICDLVTDSLPSADALFCRDCLVHLPLTQIHCALTNMARSDLRYVLLTTFTGPHANGDIPVGEWRPLNLRRAPFGLPAPLELINEECPEGGGAFLDKSIGVWPMSALRASLVSQARARA